MQVVNYSHARNNLKSLIDIACDGNEEILITTKNNKTVVLISLDEYNRTYAMLKRSIQEAILQIEKGEFVSIDEAFKKARQSNISKY